MNEQPAGRNPFEDRFVYLDEEAIAKLIDARLTAAEYRLFLALSLIDPFGNAKVTTSGEMLRNRLGMSRATYHRAIATLQEKELFDVEDVVLRVRNRIGIKSPERKVSKMRLESQKRDEDLKNETEVSKMRILEPEISSGQGFHNSSIDLNTDQNSSIEKKERETRQFLEEQRPINKGQFSLPIAVEEENRDHPSVIDLVRRGSEWTKFSAPGSDPEFFDFVCRRAAKFENPVPSDVKCVAEGWIRKQGHILHREYLDWQEERQRRQAIAVCEPPKPIPAVEPTEAERQANALARLRVKYRQPTLRAAALKECEQWGFTLADLGVSHGDG